MNLERWRFELAVLYMWTTCPYFIDCRVESLKNCFGLICHSTAFIFLMKQRNWTRSSIIMPDKRLPATEQMYFDELSALYRLFARKCLYLIYSNVKSKTRIRIAARKAGLGKVFLHYSAPSFAFSTTIYKYIINKQPKMWLAVKTEKTDGELRTTYFSNTSSFLVSFSFSRDRACCSRRPVSRTWCRSVFSDLKHQYRPCEIARIGVLRSREFILNFTANLN